MTSSAPGRRVTAPRPQRVTLVAVTAAVLIVVVVLAARALLAAPAGSAFVARFPGQSELPAWAPVGIPGWLQWQHGLSAFLMLFIIRTGWLVRTTRKPDAYFTRRNARLLRTAGQPVRISLQLWFHLLVDALWMLNGLVFFVLLVVTGQWVRIVPTRWDVFPHAASAALQYASLRWPTEDGWVNYNALQLLSYFVVVFVMSPLAILTGLRMAPGLASWWRRFERFYPLEAARRLHFPLMIAFAAFFAVHVVLVLATGALRNLNHMYGGRNDDSWVGLAVFAASVAVMAAGWVALRPVVLRTVAGTMGRVGR